MKKVLAMLVVAIIVCQGFAVLSPTARAQAPTGSAPEVICVPFHGTLLGVPHDAWLGKEIVLKGTAHDPDGDSTLEAYKWDFGDGYSTDWIAGVNPYIIEARHTYTGSMADGTPYGVGKHFTAWLYVRDADGLVGQDSYFIAIRDKTLYVEVNVAIDDGLWWLHKQAYRYTSGGIDYARWSSHYIYHTSATAETVLAFEIQGHQSIGNPDENPYVETVQRGLNYVFSQTRVVDISAWGPGTSSPYGDPDTNGNDIGIGISSGQEVYELGMVMMAIAASGDPDLTADTGPAGVVGRTYMDILTDMVDICAWGQNDYGGARGGWRYAWNYGSSDNSVSQWPMMALEAAETNWGIAVADFVKPELDTYWLTYSQRADGGFGYSYPGASNIARTGTGIIGLNYVGLPADNSRIAKAVDWLGTHWGEFGNYYGMYAVMKGMRTAKPEIKMVGTHNWYTEYARYLVDNQQADDGWPNYYGRVLATDWAILIMTPTVTKPGPVAVAGTDVDNFPPTIPLELDASGSHHMDPTKSIMLYEWDFDSDGTWDYTGTDLEVEHAYPAYYYVPFFGQRDPAWANELLGGDGPTISNAGCALTSAAMVMAYYGVDTDPKMLNELIGRLGYDANYNIYWSVVSEKCHTDQNQIKYEGKIEPYSSEEVNNQLDAGRPPIVEVGGHFVVITKREGTTYYINDPWDENIKTLDHYPTRTGLRIFSGKPRTIDWDATAKDYTATLRVTDNSDPALQDTDTCVIHITAPPWKPVAHIDGPYEGHEGVPIQLDGSKSYDPESKMYPEDHPWYETIVKYEWDLDNDGQFDDSNDPKPWFTWESKGSYGPGLRVTDSQPSGPGGTIGPLDVGITYTTVVIEEPKYNVAVIMAEPKDIDHHLDNDKGTYEDVATKVHDYYFDISYQTVAVSFDVYDNGGQWYKLDGEIWRIPLQLLGIEVEEEFGTELFYGKDRELVDFTIPIINYPIEYVEDFTILFAIEAILKADKDINYDQYDAIIIVHSGTSYQQTHNKDKMTTAYYGIHGLLLIPTITAEDPYPDVARNPMVIPEGGRERMWAHELGHAFGSILVGHSLPDRYKNGWIGNWGLMCTGKPPTHMCGYSKRFLQWLKYKEVNYGNHWINSLETMELNDEISIFKYKKVSYEIPNYYIIEARTTRSTPSLLLYNVDVRLFKSDTVNLLESGDYWYGDQVLTYQSDYYVDPDIDVRFTFEESREVGGNVEIKTSIAKSASQKLKGASLQSLADVLSAIQELFTLPPSIIPPLPDLDLHAYSADGSHVGMNYETGEYEIHIPDALASGDSFNGREWIFVPEDLDVYFAVSAQDNGAFLDSFPQAEAFTDGVESYIISVVYYDPDENRYESSPVVQEILPDEEIIHRFAIIPNPDGTYTPVIDDTPPVLTVETPQENVALQDGVTLKAYAWDENGISSVTFSIREPNGEQGTPISPDFEHMPATLATDDTWELPFDTTLLPDGFYVAYVEATDIAGNIASNVTSFSIRNWACIELLPASESNKAGRTMPVKFSLRVAEAVDPAQPFVYNEELTIIIHEEGYPEPVLQESTYCDTARDYRIDSISELYITNFQTIRRKPKTYMVEVYRKDMLIGWFTFETVK